MQRVKLGIAQPYELLAQVLGGVRGALARALARSLRVLLVVRCVRVSRGRNGGSNG